MEDFLTHLNIPPSSAGLLVAGLLFVFYAGKTAHLLATIDNRIKDLAERFDNRITSLETRFHECQLTAARCRGRCSE